MALVLTDERNYRDIADAIRAHFESDEGFLPEEMAGMVRAMSPTSTPRAVCATRAIDIEDSSSAASEPAFECAATSSWSGRMVGFTVTATRG